MVLTGPVSRGHWGPARDCRISIASQVSAASLGRDADLSTSRHGNHVVVYDRLHTSNRPKDHIGNIPSIKCFVRG